MMELADESSPRALWAAVLLQAVRDTKAEPTPHARSRAAAGVNVFIDLVRQAEEAKFEAVEWFATEDCCIGSFMWICEILDLDHNNVRARALRAAEVADISSAL
jgi:hypothetical protein